MKVDSATEKLLSLQLRALIEEWGPEYVRLRVPASWRRFGITKVGRVQLEFAEIAAIVIAVEHPDCILQFDVACN